MDTELLTKKEVAELLKVSERTIDRMRDMEYDLGELKILGAIRFYRPKIQQLLERLSAKK